MVWKRTKELLLSIESHSVESYFPTAVEGSSTTFSTAVQSLPLVDDPLANAQDLNMASHAHMYQVIIMLILVIIQDVILMVTLREQEPHSSCHTFSR